MSSSVFVLLFSRAVGEQSGGGGGGSRQPAVLSNGAEMMFVYIAAL